MAFMPVNYVKDARTAHPTGDPNFAVKQCFPAAVPEDESDPFLMCDEFGPTPSTGAHGDDSDEGFDVGWHPHHGMDILSYMVEGKGRHADSLGNRETFDSPGFQWLSVGSGIEHAEGGGTPAGQRMEDDPRYGTVNPSEIPVVPLKKGLVRVIAGPLEKVVGPAKFAVNVQMLDVTLEAGEEWQYSVPAGMDNAMIYGFKGSVKFNGRTDMKAQQICRFDTSGEKTAFLAAGPQGFRGLVFTGQMTKEKILWHGPFVCKDRRNLESCFRKYQTGEFPPKRVPWDYRDVTQRPRR